MTLHTAAVGGNMRQMNLAPFSVWSSVQRYITGDLVVYSTQIWQASTNSLGNTPTSTSTGWVSVLSGGGGGGTPGGSATEFQYNDSGAFAGSPTWVISTGASPTVLVSDRAVTTGNLSSDVASFLRSKGNAGGENIAVASTDGRASIAVVDPTNGGQLNFYQMGGTLEVPTKSVVSRKLGTVQFLGFDADFDSTIAGGYIEVQVVDHDWALGDHPAQVKIASDAGVGIIIYDDNNTLFNLKPTLNNIIDLGVSTGRWKNAWFGGVDVVLSGLTTAKPANVGGLYVSSSGVVLWSTGP